jgi:homocitrate synthase NifV
MTELFDKITGKKTKKNKPVIGRQIFNVESGVHVDGILKQPECYEPFPPEAVGQKRKIVLGKQSGTASVKAKLSELNLDCAEDQVPQILEKIKSKAMEKNGEVTNTEFAEIVKGLGV